MEDGFFDPGTTVGAIGRGHTFDPVEGLIKGDVASLELSEQCQGHCTSTDQIYMWAR